MNRIYYLSLNVFLFFSLFNSRSQVNVNYKIEANLNLKDETVIISQTIKYKNIRTNNSNELYYW